MEKYEISIKIPINKNIPKDIPNSEFLISKNNVEKINKMNRMTDLIKTVNPNFDAAFTISFFGEFLKKTIVVNTRIKLIEKLIIIGRIFKGKNDFLFV